MTQVGKDAYSFLKYCYPDRWASYYYQLREVIDLKPGTLLEIGTGDGVFKNYIKNATGIEYRNLDIAEDLHPDIVGSVEHIPLPDRSVDAVAAFEILEHLPFEKFERGIAEIARVASKAAVISLPHFGPPVTFSLKLPFLSDVRFAWKIPYPRVHRFNGQHYWELGKRGYPVRKIRAVLAKHFRIEKEFIPFENQYHHFFVLTKKK